MFCKNCGNEIKDGTRFCGNCGTEQVTNTDLLNKPDNEVKIENKANASALNGDTVVTNNSHKNISYIFVGIAAVLIIIALLWVIIAGAEWVISSVKSVFFDEEAGTGVQDTDDIGANTLGSYFDEPAIRMNYISFDDSMNTITYDIENISDKDIAYITFETYFYDRMGGALSTDYLGESYSLNLKYTGPLYSGGEDSVYWDYLFSMPSGTAVVYPKIITVTFTDDEEITFENSVYSYTDDFYGGELKDKE